MATVALPAVIKEARQRQRRRRNLIIVFFAAFVVAAGATLLTVFRVSLGNGLHVSFRQSETFQATEFLEVHAVPPSFAQRLGIRDPARWAGDYAELVNSDAVRAVVLKGGPLRGGYVASTPDGPGPSPVTLVNATASNPRQAVAIAKRVATTFQAYAHENNQGFLPSDRIRILSNSPRASLLHGRSVERPLIRFILLLIISLIVAKLAMRGLAAVRWQRS